MSVPKPSKWFAKQVSHLEAGKLGLKEFLTECLQPAPLSPGGTRAREMSTKQRSRNSD